VVDAERRPRIELSLEGGGDAEGARAAALPFLADVEEGRLVCAIVRGGEVPHIRVVLSGDTPDDLKQLRSLTIDGRVENGRIDLPFLHFDAREVSGAFRIADGFLEAGGIRAGRDGLRADDGFLRLGLAPADQPIALDLAIDADLGVLPGVLGRMIDNPDFQRELKRFREVAGHAAGRLRLSGRIPDVAVGVDATDIDARGSFEAVPYPIALRGGRLTYSRETLTLTGVDVGVGRSKSTRQDAVLELTGERRLRASSPQAVIDLAEAFAWCETIRPLPGLRGLDGILRLADWRVDGPLDTPEAWNVAAAGGLSAVTVTTDPLPTPVRVPSATIAWDGRHVRLGELDPSWGRSSVAGLTLEADWSQVPRLAVQAAHAALSLEDVLPLLLKSEPNLAAGLGPILPLSGQTALQAIRADLRFPAAGLEIVSASATIGESSVASALLPHPLVVRSGTASLNGTTVAVSGLDAGYGRSEVHGFALSARREGGLDLRAARADIDCGEVFAALAALPAAEALRRDISAVNGAMHVSELRLSPPAPGRHRWTARVEADIRDLAVSTSFLDDPIRVGAARVRAFDTGGTAAPGAALYLERTQVHSGRNSAAVSGVLTLTDAGTELDLTVAAESLDWSDISRTIDRISARRPPSAEPAALNGRIRLRAEQFVYERYRFEPLEVTAELGGAHTDILINRARFCGMDLIGRIGTQGQQVDLYLVPIVAGVDLEGTMRCVTHEASAISGAFNLNGEIYGAGRSDGLLNALSGTLQLTAEQGTIRRSLFFARILALLNLTEIYRGQLPDLNTQGIEFQRAAARAEVKDGKILIPEWSLQGRTFWMGARGEIDLTTQQIDFTIMVSPFRTIDRIVNSIPGVRWILGGRLIAIPMRATGSVDDPRLTPLSVSAVGTSLLEMAKRTLMLPLHIIQPIVPGMEQQEKNTISR